MLDPGFRFAATLGFLLFTFSAARASGSCEELKTRLLMSPFACPTSCSDFANIELTQGPKSGLTDQDRAQNLIRLLSECGCGEQSNITGSGDSAQPATGCGPRVFFTDPKGKITWSTQRNSARIECAGPFTKSTGTAIADGRDNKLTPNRHFADIHDFIDVGFGESGKPAEVKDGQSCTSCHLHKQGDREVLSDLLINEEHAVGKPGPRLGSRDWAAMCCQYANGKLVAPRSECVDDCLRAQPGPRTEATVTVMEQCNQYGLQPRPQVAFNSFVRLPPSKICVDLVKTTWNCVKCHSLDANLYNTSLFCKKVANQVTASDLLPAGCKPALVPSLVESPLDPSRRIARAAEACGCKLAAAKPAPDGVSLRTSGQDLSPVNQRHSQ